MDLSLFDETPTEGPFTVLTVCTGNICRSPLAETLLRMVLNGLPVNVHSAGTHALVGSPMPEQSLRIAADLGSPDAVQHRAKQLTEEHLREADLVIALAREHRRKVVEMVPRAGRKTFTLREFARLATAMTETATDTAHVNDSGARMRAAVSALAPLRGLLPPLTDPLDDDVVDPYRQTDSVYQESTDQLVPAVNATATLLRAAASQAR